MSSGEGVGVGVLALGLVGFAVTAALAMTHTLDDVLVWALGADTIATLASAAATALAVAVLAGMAHLWSRSGKLRIHYAPHRDHATGGHDEDTIRHEALGHAAVGHGVGGTGIRAKVNPDGSGWCEVNRRGLTLAQSLAITYGGEAAAGPAGCDKDQARFKRDLRKAPRRYRSQVKAEAISLAHQHVGNAFGHKVARALRRSGRYR